MKKMLWLSAAMVAVLNVGEAQAQDAPAAAAEPTPDAPATPAPPAAEAGDPAGGGDDATATDAERALEEDLGLFWGARRKVSVVQKRLFEKDGRFELTAFGSTIPNDDFIIYFPVGLRAGYHFSESFSVEGSFAYAIDNQTDLASFLEGEGIDLKRADLQEIVRFYYNVDILWAPIYGKISFLGSKLTHFETYVGLGAGIFHTDEYPAENPEGNSAIKPAGNAVLGFRWFLTDHLNIRTDYRHFFFQKFGGGVSIPAEFSLALGVLI